MKARSFTQFDTQIKTLILEPGVAQQSSFLGKVSLFLVSFRKPYISTLCAESCDRCLSNVLFTPSLTDIDQR